jgi:hypothetical protein
MGWTPPRVHDDRQEMKTLPMNGVLLLPGAFVAVGRFAS